MINILLVVFFYAMLPGIAARSPGSMFAAWYDPALGTGYVILANLAASAIKLLLLTPQVLRIRFEWDNRLWKEMLIYSIPLVIVGFGGVINETFDRIMLGWWSSAPTETARKTEVGIYSACYKLSLLITLFVQAFRLGAEPFFFQQAKGQEAPKVYARVMKFFVITICTMFLFVMFYIDWWKYFITNHTMWVGLKVVPVLLIANMCIGVYYNLAIWYKVANRTRAGATITIIGALITLIVNYFFIPQYSYMACAWATFFCYASMMVISFIWGQRAYPIPYELSRMSRYFGLMLLLYFINLGADKVITGTGKHIIIGTVFFAAYVLFIYRQEKQELRRLPLIGKRQ